MSNNYVFNDLGAGGKKTSEKTAEHTLEDDASFSHNETAIIKDTRAITSCEGFRFAGTKRADVILLLKNRSNDCFANAAVQVLHLFFREEILKLDSFGAVAKLQQIFTKARQIDCLLNEATRGYEIITDRNGKFVEELNTYDEFNDGEDHDAEDFIEYLLMHKLPKEFIKSFKFTENICHQCNECSSDARGSSQPVYSIKVRSNERGMPFVHYMQSAEGTTKVVKNCGSNMNAIHDEVSTYSILNTLNYLRVIIHTHTDEYTHVRRNMQLPQKKTEIFGKLWSPRIMVECVDRQNARHYQVYIKNDFGWLKISDNIATQLSEWEMDMSCITAVYFEKVQDLVTENGLTLSMRASTGNDDE